MARIRKTFQGTWNIIRFNWHFYALAGIIILGLLLLGYLFLTKYLSWIYLMIALILVPTIISLTVSYYIYDASNLYQLDWLKIKTPIPHILNINAGFDESSILLKDKFVDCQLTVFDFYNPKLHTEVSIKRARKVYPPYPGTIQINTDSLPLEPKSMDQIFLFLSAHEIRNEQERIQFFKELKRVLKEDGQIYVTEHLRDLPNFLAYNIGYLHFHNKSCWLKTFKDSGLQISQEIKTTPFISNFILNK